MERVELQQQLEEVEKGHRGQLTSLGQESTQLRRELEAKITSLEKELNEVCVYAGRWECPPLLFVCLFVFRDRSCCLKVRIVILS